ncbi:MAG: ABC transporter ATP-binding protein [Gemmatimonadaceae bacterium]
MTMPIISARDVGKRYLLGRRVTGSKSLREALGEAVRAPFNRMRNATGTGGAEFWALREVSFDVAPGEVMGVIGRNGAGKSTLLKVLSRITDPTTGRIEIRGRAAALLEVGTGFHPELTGRENVYLNGTILGMRKREIDRKFDEIVAFAEVAEFIDTPVKRYSSGMYVRLAFGVAAHLDPEILIVDEVLAVGDAEFQKKCLTKMSDVAHEGRTVLFVSHNMAAVRAICTTGIHLRGGTVVARGPVGAVVDEYVRSAVSTAAAELIYPRRDAKPQFTRLALTSATSEYGGMLEIEADLSSDIPASVAIEMEIHDERGSPLAYVSTAPMGSTLIPLQPGVPRRVGLRLGPMPFARGRYDLYSRLTMPYAANYHVVPEPLSFEIVHADPGHTGFDFRQSWGFGATTVPLSVVDEGVPAARS